MVSEEALKWDLNGFLPSRDDMTEAEYLEECQLKSDIDDHIYKNPDETIEQLLGEKPKGDVRICDPLRAANDDMADPYKMARGVFLKRFLSIPTYGLVLDNEDFIAAVSKCNESSGGVIDKSMLHNKKGSIVYVSSNKVDATIPLILVNLNASEDILNTVMHENVHRLRGQIDEVADDYNEILAYNWNSDNLDEEKSKGVNIHNFHDMYFMMVTGKKSGNNMWYVMSRVRSDETVAGPVQDWINEIPGLRGEIIRANYKD